MISKTGIFQEVSLYVNWFKKKNSYLVKQLKSYEEGILLVSFPNNKYMNQADKMFSQKEYLNAQQDIVASCTCDLCKSQVAWDLITYSVEHQGVEIQ